jgi:hypothetical protein
MVESYLPQNVRTRCPPAFPHFSPRIPQRVFATFCLAVEAMKVVQPKLG